MIGERLLGAGFLDLCMGSVRGPFFPRLPGRDFIYILGPSSRSGRMKHNPHSLIYPCSHSPSPANNLRHGYPKRNEGILPSADVGSVLDSSLSRLYFSSLALRRPSRRLLLRKEKWRTLSTIRSTASRVPPR